MEVARLQSRGEAASAAAQELEARAHASAATSAGATASAQQAQRDVQAKVGPVHSPFVLTRLLSKTTDDARFAFKDVGLYTARCDAP